MSKFQLFKIEEANTTTFGGGDGLAKTSPFRVVTHVREVLEPLAHPFTMDNIPEDDLRYYADCARSVYAADYKNEHEDKIYQKLLEGGVVQTMTGKVQIRKLE